MVCHSLLQWTPFCQTSPPWPDRLAWPHTTWLSFTELDKTVVVWSDWLVFCDYGFTVPAPWCPLASPTVLLGFLLPWTWVISSRLLQQSAAAAPYLGWRDLLTTAPPDLERGVAPLGRSCAVAAWHSLWVAARDLWRGVAPPGRASVRFIAQERVEAVSDFIFLGSKVTADGDCSHEIKRLLRLGRKVMINLDSILKHRDMYSASWTM